MNKSEAVKIIREELVYGSLPRAIEIYNYLTIDGELDITADMIREYFKCDMFQCFSHEGMSL